MRPFDSRPASAAREPLAQGGPAGAVLLWGLACASTLLLIYEAATLIGSVLRPLIANPQAIQTDFHYYYEAALRFRAEPMRLYASSDDVIAGFAYPPPAILPFVWLSNWPLGTALLAFTIASYLVLFVAAQQWMSLLRRHGFAIDRSTSIAVLLIVFASGPVYMNAIFGQVNAFVLATVVAFVSLAATSILEASLLLAAGTWLKVYPIVLAAIGLWDRPTRRALAWSVAAAIVMGFAAAIVIPLPNFITFLFEVMPARAGITAIHITNQSLVAFIERFFFTAPQFLNWTGEEAITVGIAMRVFNLLFAAAAIGMLWLRACEGPRDQAFSAAALIALIAVMVPLGWGHTYVMVLPLVMLHLVALRDARPAIAMVVFVCVAALMIPAGRQFAFLQAAPDWLLNLIYSRYLFATLVLVAIPSIPIGRTTESPSVAFS
jgi:alpha-1,2-mannosyltransferase